jgi:peptide/nickel transport system permease protein
VFAYLVRRLALMAADPVRDLDHHLRAAARRSGNIVDILFDAAGFVDPADKANLEKELGLNQPIVVQYFNWISGLFAATSAIPTCRRSRRCRRYCRAYPSRLALPVLRCCSPPRSASRSASSAPCTRAPRLDYTLRVVSLSGLSLPSFWLGLLILMASVSLFGAMPIFNPNPKTWTEAFAIYAVPAMAVGFRSAALTMRITRSSMLEILRQDYIRTARAKGASETR